MLILTSVRTFIKIHLFHFHTFYISAKSVFSGSPCLLCVYQRTHIRLFYKSSDGCGKIQMRFALAGFLNGKLFDIKGVEGTGKNNIINKFKGASKKEVESIVLYYHDKTIFSEKQIREGYQFYLRNSQNKGSM